MDRGSQLDEDDEDDKDDKEDEEEAGGRRRQEEEATDIKSNNPHLAGGEQPSPGRWGKKHIRFPAKKRSIAVSHNN